MCTSVGIVEADNDELGTDIVRMRDPSVYSGRSKMSYMIVQRVIRRKTLAVHSAFIGQAQLSWVGVGVGVDDYLEKNTHPFHVCDLYRPCEIRLVQPALSL